MVLDKLLPILFSVIEDLFIGIGVSKGIPIYTMALTIALIYVLVVFKNEIISGFKMILSRIGVF